jgi:fluoride exporter
LFKKLIVRARSASTINFLNHFLNHFSNSFSECDMAILVLIPFDGLGQFTPEGSPLLAPLTISVGAIPGALSRYYLGKLLSDWFGTSFPVGTFVINLSGALLMGFLAMVTVERVVLSPELQLLMMTGFLGSYTTFSTYALDISTLLRRGTKAKAFLYGAGSTVLGLVCLKIGIGLAMLLN